MHESSYEKMRAFRDEYVENGGRVLDVGSGSREGGLSYRSLFDGCEYVGLDIEAGYNVDLVPADPFAWPELETESFDVVVSGQTFEHNPYFWITAAEMARVLVPGGVVALTAPSGGKVHRFPLDCWRFYPDSWAALCEYVGLELVESWIEEPTLHKVIPGVGWGDAMMIARKPPDIDYGRLAAIVSTRVKIPSGQIGAGPAAARYEQTHSLPTGELVHHPLHVLKSAVPDWRQWGPVKRVRRKINAKNGQAAIERGNATQ